MKFYFKGNLFGYLCDDCRLPLNNIKVRLFRTNQEHETTLATAAPKETFRQLTAKEVDAKKQFLIAESLADDHGNFEFTLDQKEYKGGAFEIDFECGTVPHKWPKPPKKNELLQFNITTLQPAWRQLPEKDDLFFSWEYGISSRWFCKILSIYGAYAICGKLVDCKTGKPLSQVRVEAFDVDLIQDDALGSGVTDTNGRFVIFYTEADFSKTIFSWLNIEWPAGPDIFFKFYDAPTNGFIFAEERSFGRSVGRENRGHCFCVKLCINYEQPSQEGIEVPAYFRAVGGYDIHTQFNAAGRTNDAEDNAFTRAVLLNGNLPPAFASNAIEYRFRIQRMVGAVVVNEYIPGANVSADWILPTLIGSLTRNVIPVNPGDPTQIVEPYYLNKIGEPHNISIGADGWIKVPRENSWATGMYMHQYPGSIVSLANFDTTKLVDEAFDLNAPTIHKAGNLMDAADKFPGQDHVFRIIGEFRKVSTTNPNPNPITQKTLQKINIWNAKFSLTRHPGWNGGAAVYKGVGMLDIKETIDAGCGKVNNEINALYTAYHPYIASVSGHVEGPSGSFGHFNPLPSAFGEASGTHTVSLVGMPNCAYILWMTTTYRLTSGYGRISDNYDVDHIAFCKG